MNSNSLVDDARTKLGPMLKKQKNIRLVSCGHFEDMVISADSGSLERGLRKLEPGLWCDKDPKYLETETQSPISTRNGVDKHNESGALKSKRTSMDRLISVLERSFIKL